MFRNRQSQKPSDELYKSFKENFSQLNQGGMTTSAPPAQDVPSFADYMDDAINQRQHAHSSNDSKDAKPTPRALNDSWNFNGSGLTPSIMDPNSHSYGVFGNPMSYYATPGGSDTLYRNQAGDLHTPGFGFGLGTPLSLPTSEGTLHAGQQSAGFHGFHNDLSHHVPSQNSFQNVNPLHMHQQTAFPPHHFSHQNSFDQLDSAIDQSPIDDIGVDMNLHQQHNSPQLLFHSQNLQNTLRPPTTHPTGEKFRYHVTLNAPTAMVKQSDEIPITYLNKGQAYTLNVLDSHGRQAPASRGYRTYVRISFEDEQQRARPGACWQLWKEGRGSNEAHQRGGLLQAVEYVESGQLGGAEDPNKPRVTLDSFQPDGFCVYWTPAQGSHDCSISVRFNFLSTDFSHSKGVKGIPVRLCTKTEAVKDSPSKSAQQFDSEVCYCKVKLFRDHGAERKLSNDVAHVKKTIDKLNQQIAQIESGVKESGKRKRSGSVAKIGPLEGRPGKMPKHRRTWSMSSVTSASGRGNAEEDLHNKLMTLQDMFTSTRPASILYLLGDKEDDPDEYPVKITDMPQSLLRNDSAETNNSSTWDKQSTQTGLNSALVSPSPSSISIGLSRRPSRIQQPTPFGGTSRVNSSEWRNQVAAPPKEVNAPLPQQLVSPPEDLPVKIKKQTLNDETPKYDTLQVIGVDPTYQPPAEPPIKPVACLYIKPRIIGRPATDDYHRAIYLMRRTLNDFNRAAATKCGIEPTRILRTIRYVNEDIQVKFTDDGDIIEIPEGQDMIAEFREIEEEQSTPIKTSREWDAGLTDFQVDGDLQVTETVNTSGYELRLVF